MIVLYLIVAAATGYLAGIYHNRGLMVLFVAELLMMAVMFLLCVVFRISLGTAFVQPSDRSSLEHPYSCRIRVTRRGILPVSRFRIHFSVHTVSADTEFSAHSARTATTTHRTGKRPAHPAAAAGAVHRAGKRSAHSAAAAGAMHKTGRRSAEKKRTAPRYIDSGIDTPSAVVTFPVDTSCCGFTVCEIRKLQVWDYLKLFRLSQKCRDRMLLTILPEAEPLTFPALASLHGAEHVLKDIPDFAGPGDDHSEVRQIRDYRPEDSLRSIHWKQSARLDRLMIREFEREQTPVIPLFLNPDGIEAHSLEHRNCFYQLIYSVMLGFLTDGFRIHLYWKTRASEKDTGFSALRHLTIDNPEQCAAMMPVLYQWTTDSAALRRYLGSADRKPSGGPHPSADSGYDRYFSDSLTFRAEESFPEESALQEEDLASFPQIDADLCFRADGNLMERFPAEWQLLMQRIRSEERTYT